MLNPCGWHASQRFSHHLNSLIQFPYVHADGTLMPFFHGLPAQVRPYTDRGSIFTGRCNPDSSTAETARGRQDFGHPVISLQIQIYKLGRTQDLGNEPQV